MATRIRTCAKRERPNVPLTLRLAIADADTIANIAEEIGAPVSVVLEKLVLYALPRVRLAEVTRREIRFPEDEKLYGNTTTNQPGREG